MVISVPDRPVVRLRPKADARRIRHGYPWVWADQLVTDRRSRALAPGTIATLEDAERAPLPRLRSTPARRSSPGCSTATPPPGSTAHGSPRASTPRRSAREALRRAVLALGPCRADGCRASSSTGSATSRSASPTRLGRAMIEEIADALVSGGVDGRRERRGQGRGASKGSKAVSGWPEGARSEGPVDGGAERAT